jgi:hypothetical protein
MYLPAGQSRVKPVRLSQHALDQARLRGATEDEVKETIRTMTWTTAKRGKVQARKTFAFGRASPINGNIYPSKTVHVIFADEPAEIVAITVLVYYHYDSYRGRDYEDLLR